MRQSCLYKQSDCSTDLPEDLEKTIFPNVEAWKAKFNKKETEKDIALFFPKLKFYECYYNIISLAIQRGKKIRHA